MDEYQATVLNLLKDIMTRLTRLEVIETETQMIAESVQEGLGEVSARLSDLEINASFNTDYE